MHRESKTDATVTMAITLSILCGFAMDLQHFFIATKSTKCSTKPILGYPPHLKCVSALPWKTQKSEIVLSRACKTCFKCDFLSSIQQIKMPNVMKISAKINTMQNINILHGVNLCTYFHDIWQTSVG